MRSMFDSCLRLGRDGVVFIEGIKVVWLPTLGVLSGARVCGGRSGGEVDTLPFRDRYFFLRLSGCGMGTWDEVDDSM